jgi:dihydrofolate reductase
MYLDLSNIVQAPSDALNAVIMGRKTWESIPAKFRPLKGRLSIVISRSFTSPPQDNVNAETDPIQVSSLEQAVEYLQSKHAQATGKAFVIGGAQIYAAALGLQEARRILMTKVLTDFECDTDFPLSLHQDPAPSDWVLKSKEELDRWVGEEVPAGTQVENSTSYEFQMWERVD